MSQSDLGSQTAAIDGLNMSSAAQSADELLLRLEAAVDALTRMAARPTLPLVLTVKAAAAQLSVSERTMRTLLATGEVASVLVGGRRMVPGAELERVAARATATSVKPDLAPRRVPRGRGLDVAKELQVLESTKRRRARG
jgi:excisionase family DNA binding protein